MFALLFQPERIGSPILGVLLPALIFGLSVVLTYLMIRHFTKEQDSE